MLSWLSFLHPYCKYTRFPVGWYKYHLIAFRRYLASPIILCRINHALHRTPYGIAWHHFHSRTHTPVPRIATAFTGIVNSLVTDVLLPFASLLPFMGRNISGKFTILRRGTSCTVVVMNFLTLAVTRHDT